MSSSIKSTTLPKNISPVCELNLWFSPQKLTEFKMSLTQTLTQALDDGLNQIGQIAILRDEKSITLCHLDDLEKVKSGNTGDLIRHTNPADAVELSLYAADGHYRFTKGELSLRSGWLFQLNSVAELRDTLDHFYPASLGLWAAEKEGRLHIQNLRDKLDRQSGMYRHAGKITDKGAHEVIRETCGPANQCVKKILWQLDDHTPLEENEATTFPGILHGKTQPQAIPLLCQEACNHLVAQCRKKAKAEFEAKE